MNDLVVVVEDLVVKDGKREWVRKYLDFLCSDANSGKNDFHYVRAVFQWLTKQKVFEGKSQVLLFSDNASKHFKNCSTVKYLMHLTTSIKIPFWWIMYALNHRWSLCDSHGGILSQMVIKTELNGVASDTAEKMQLIEQPKFTNSYSVVLMVFILLLLTFSLY
jgi:hypothetical protein